MADTHFRVGEHLHEEMKSLAAKNGTSLREEYERAIRDHIKYSTQENLKRDSGLEIYINERITRLDNHITGMMGRTGMDVSMTLMGLITLLEKLLKVPREDIQELLKRQGAAYFSSAIKREKEDR